MYLFVNTSCLKTIDTVLKLMDQTPRGDVASTNGCADTNTTAVLRS